MGLHSNLEASCHALCCDVRYKGYAEKDAACFQALLFQHKMLSMLHVNPKDELGVFTMPSWQYVMTKSANEAEIRLELSSF